MNKKRSSLIVSLFVILVVLIWQPWKQSGKQQQKASVQKGLFETIVVANGELKAQKALDINVPEVSFNEEVDIWAMKILSIIEEGKIVKKGDEVAKLEPTEVEENLASVTEKLNEQYTFVEDAKIDSSLELAASREKIQKERDRVADAELKVEQSSFESKAIQRQTKIEYEKAQRALSKAQRHLITKTQKHKSTIARSQQRVKRYENKQKLLKQLRSELNVLSPADGMIIYGRGYNGQKIKVGSRVGRWMPLIATLPDLNTIISEMKVKEIDIAKIKTGQKVEVAIDAFPKKTFMGEILSIANVGQNTPGEFQNSFKVIVKLIDYKETLLPGMTTTNSIITYSNPEAIYVDKRAVFGSDSLYFVLIKDGFQIKRQEIKISFENEEFFQIIDGVKEKDQVLLNAPDNLNELPLLRL